MKEKNFKFRMSFANAIKTMSDKKVGKLIKYICYYAFEEKEPDISDKNIKCLFDLIKVTIDNDKIARENGKIGGIKSVEKRKNSEGKILIALGIKKNDKKSMKEKNKEIKE